MALESGRRVELSTVQSHSDMSRRSLDWQMLHRKRSMDEGKLRGSDVEKGERICGCRFVCETLDLGIQ